MSNMKHFIENYNELINDYNYERKQARVWKMVAYRLHEDCYCHSPEQHLEALHDELEKENE